MKDKEYIIINNKLLYIDRFYYESDEMFYFRINFIIDIFNKNKNIDNFDTIIGLSKIEQEKKFNNCLY
jgi:hypothetical protein